MEGVELHPEIDDQGVHWFDLAEVDAVLSQRSAGRYLDRGQFVRVEQVDEFPAEPSLEAEEDRADPGELARGTAEARAWAEQARADALAIQQERQRLDRERRKALAADAQADRELASVQRALLDELASFDGKTWRRLSRRDADEILALLEGECPDLD